MSAVLVDTNVLLDLFLDDPVWGNWSRDQVARLVGGGDRLLVCPIVYAEVGAGFECQQELDAAIGALPIDYEETPKAGLYLAGRAFTAYKRRGGTRASPLPDLLIGGHAQAVGHRILTRDRAPYRTYFPSVRLVTP